MNLTARIGSEPPDLVEVPPAASKPRFRMSTRNRILFFLTAWLIVLMPFLFWWSTWFGRPLSERELTSYLRDDKHPRHIQHALVQIGERMARQQPSATQWDADVIRLAAYPVEEVRNTDAWVMGQETAAAGFHQALLKMLDDPSPLVRGNAALSLVRFGDAAGRPQIVALLQPATVNAPEPGKIVDASRPGTAIHRGGMIAKLQSGTQVIEVRSPISGRIRTLFAKAGQTVGSGGEIASVDPDTEQAWEALRALYLVGRPEDIAAIVPYEREVPEIPDRLRQQAVLAEQAIRARADQPAGK